ncbi:alpha-N-acetylgalactosaminidase-like [Watersipora subatra]|uniref:alpha-N-acetylgalactosaminidase-like n=1 Tax=Watersipora subatra TaxID=2589382 RepID=UPI00355C734F
MVLRLMPLLLLALSKPTFSLDNGLALTPPMGWMAWERFRCNTDCLNDPDNCISEKLIKAMADKIVQGGYKDAGYQYVSIDDCWLAKERDSNGKLQPDAARFPSGIAALAAYIHNLGLKFGIYEDIGTKTCAGYPGSYANLETDAQTFADWGVDMLKLDGCYANASYYAYGYPAMSKALNKTGRPIMYSCSWPAYIQTPPYDTIAKYCNIWRNYGDIQDNWSSVYSIIDHYGNNTDKFAEIAGPGQYNDPDELIIGDFGITYDQWRAQMALWAIYASPLIMSVDLRNIDPSAAKILLNRNVIAVNQDPLGKQGRRVFKGTIIETYIRELKGNSMAVALLRTTDGPTPVKINRSLEDLGLSVATSYDCYEVFEGSFIGTLSPKDDVSVWLNPSGGVYFMLCHPNPSPSNI